MEQDFAVFKPSSTRWQESQQREDMDPLICEKSFVVSHIFKNIIQIYH